MDLRPGKSEDVLSSNVDVGELTTNHGFSPWTNRESITAGNDVAIQISPWSDEGQGNEDFYETRKQYHVADDYEALHAEDDATGGLWLNLSLKGTTPVPSDVSLPVQHVL